VPPCNQNVPALLGQQQQKGGWQWTLSHIYAERLPSPAQQMRDYVCVKEPKEFEKAAHVQGSRGLHFSSKRARLSDEATPGAGIHGHGQLLCRQRKGGSQR